MIETMAYTGATPWHKLGNEVSNDLTPEAMAIAAGCNWGVEKLPVYQSWNNEFVSVADRFNLTRMSDGKVLDIVGPMYQPVQNVEALEFFTEFVSAGGMKMETAGSLDGGRRVWGLASIQQGFTLAGGDKVGGYLLLCNPHRQGEAFTIKFTPVRVVCHNTITMALNGGGANFRMSHSNRFDADMQHTAKMVLGLAQTRLQEFEAKAELLAETKVASEARLVEYISTLSGSKVLDAIMDETELGNVAASGAGNGDGRLLDAILAAEEGRQTVKAVRACDLNKAGKMILDAIISSPGSDMPSAQGTWWGAVNGVTYAVDHQMGRTDDSRLTSAWFGQRASLKERAVELAVAYARG